VPVPLHPRRLVERGYNQSALLARELGKATGLTTSLRGLQRVVYTEQQSRLAREARLTNLAGAFVARTRLSGRAVVLVDDVATTGATLAACACAAREAGAIVVGALGIAHTE
jgi:ComF family protein